MIGIASSRTFNLLSRGSIARTQLISDGMLFVLSSDSFEVNVAPEQERSLLLAVVEVHARCAETGTDWNSYDRQE